MLEQDSGASPPPEPEDLRRFAQMSFADLGWRTLRNDPSAPASLPPIEASLTFAHPDHGVALVDLAPASAADPVERLRLRLEALKEKPALAVELPIVYLPLEASDLWRLNMILDSAFPFPLPREGGHGDWVDLVQRALLPDAFPPPPRERETAQPVLTTGARVTAATQPGRGRWLRWFLAGGAVVSLLVGAAAIHGLDAPGDMAAPTTGRDMVQAPQQDRPAAPAAPPPSLVPAPMKRPEPMAEQPRRPEAPSTVAPPPVDKPAPAPPPPLSAEPLRIVVHHLANRGAMAEALVGPAAGSGDDVEFRTVRATPRTAVVRYFLPEDRAAAQRLAERLGTRWQVQDLTRYRPRPSAGTLEVWLPRDF